MAAVVGTRAWPRPAVLALETAAVSACYFAAGRLGLLRRLSVDEAVVSPLWPPSGVALAFLFLLGWRAVPGIALGALFILMSLTTLGPTVLATVFGNVAAPLCAYLLLRRVGFRTDLGRLRDGVALVFLGALTSMLISASVGVVMLALTTDLPREDFWAVWLAWWVGDAMGVVIVTPLLFLVFRTRRFPLRNRRRWAEAAGMTVLAAVVLPLAAYNVFNLLFLVYPVLIWTALRFQFAGSLLCALAASVVTTSAAIQGAGSFQDLSDVQIMVKLQAFNGSVGLTALLLSAVISAQINTRRSVERACRELVHVLDNLTLAQPRRPEGPTPDEDR
ncbi:MASE1 domain-containing protein [Streptomyces sp. ZYX-F-203]